MTDDQRIDERDVVDAGSAEGVNAAAKERRRKTNRVSDFWHGVMQDEVGRHELWEIFSQGGLFQSPFQCGPNGFPQPEATWFKQGQRDFVSGLYHRLMAMDPDGVRLMLMEHDGRFKEASK